MARKKLIWYPGALYHVTSRGNHRNDIFRDEEDYEVYLTILEEALEKYKTVLYSYCLMTKYVHLFIQTTDVKVCEVMQRVNWFYTKFFNNKYNYVGHLFQGRYHAELIEKDEDILEVSRYIHLNPIKAKMVLKPKDYKWSSYAMLVGLAKEKLIDSNKILRYFKEENKMELYKQFIEKGITKMNRD